MVKYTVYILYSEKIDQFYRGQTKDLNDRLKRHNKGIEKFTQNGTPWRLMWSTIKETRSESLKLETKLKNLSRERLIRFMLKYKEDIAEQEILLFLQKLT
ncbi:GIY-YIG nuclease family protein [Marivirga sp. S37H4]|uniref:GIY-YIG nuclease family protein n=1 Tax=Marivirga aurantiaca TaxID=2802615 RepID=A0A934X186_9BACT|nr:GIY-YIG nuclease family protein [Marivirga aurantiaca]MBK6266465.1 GIY-YIG nuclease family protein [Marivirga aurantiaca]